MQEQFFSYLTQSPSPYHAVQQTAQSLLAAGCVALAEHEEWALEPGKRYFTVRGGSALVAFRAPKTPTAGWRMSAAHSDSPTFVVKSASERAGCTMLDTEGYGGMLRSTWMDRPLGIAGRVSVATKQGVETRLIAPDEDVAILPSLAIHMDREANSGHNFDAKKDTQALFGLGAGAERFETALCRWANCAEGAVLGHDLRLVCRQVPTVFGAEDALFAAPRLDDLACAFAGLEGFLAAPEAEFGTLFALFDSEEVGSNTQTGACGTLLPDVLARVGEAMAQTPGQARIAQANSVLLSADNAHATHPNFAEVADSSHPVRLGGGVVIKRNASQKYTTTGETEALVKAVATLANLPVQLYYNRPDMPGGSTLGNLLCAQASVPMADIGLPQLAMHSAVETAAVADVDALCQLLKAWYAADITKTQAGYTVAL